MSSELLQRWRPRPGDWDRAAAAHLLRRAGFGATPEELEQALDSGWEATLARLFEERVDPALEESIRPLLGTEDPGWLQAWWLALMLSGGAPLRERMVLVWHDHFACSNDKVNDPRLMHRQNELFRRGGLGDFRQLLHGLAHDPAMLVFLDGNTNLRGHPNENFARELFELFALGLGHYTERDVQEAARAFSGWGSEGCAFVVRPEQHDDGQKTILGQSGPFDGDDVVELVLAQPACARHVARVLLQAFVAPAPESAWIEALAGILVASGWHVGRALEALLSSELFFSGRARRSRIAGPVELLCVAARTLGASVPPRLCAQLANDMGQALFRPPSVKGWDGGRAWINAGSWIARHNALVRLAQALGESTDGIEVDRTRAFGASGAGTDLAARVCSRLLPDLAATGFPAACARAAATGAEHEDALVLLTALVLTSPEYQLF
jgi:uncharacterized protein (DUF1800 family)